MSGGPGAAGAYQCEGYGLDWPHPLFAYQQAGIDKLVRTHRSFSPTDCVPVRPGDVALLDGDVMPAQFAPDRIVRSDVQNLLKKVSVRPNSREFGPRP